MSNQAKEERTLFEPLRRQRDTGRQVVAASRAQSFGRARLQHDLIAPLGFVAEDRPTALVLLRLLHAAALKARSAAAASFQLEVFRRFRTLLPWTIAKYDSPLVQSTMCCTDMGISLLMGRYYTHITYGVNT